VPAAGVVFVPMRGNTHRGVLSCFGQERRRKQ